VSSVSACSLELRFGRARVLWDTRSRGGSRLWRLTYTSDGLDRHCEVCVLWWSGEVCLRGRSIRGSSVCSERHEVTTE
jgi:hypothetical protein